MNDRLSALRAALEREALDGLFISSPSNRRYCSGFSGSAGYLLITAGDALIATDFRYHEQSAAQAPGFGLIKSTRRLAEWLPKLFEGLGGRRIGFEAGDVTVALHRQIVEVIDAWAPADRPQLVPAVGIVEGLRAIKDTGELALIQRAIDIATASLARTTARIGPDWTEHRLAWELEGAMRELGAEAAAFSTIVAGGAWASQPHAYPRDTVLQDGAGVVIDMGARVEGYCSDMTRTITLGRPDARFETIYDIVLAAQLAAAEMIEPGMTGEQAHQIGHSVIEAAGYGECFGHGLGHGIGLQVHEAPLLAPTSTDVLREGMVFSIEPGIYIPGWGGVRIEDLAVLENGRCRFLSHAPKVRLSAASA